MIALGLALAMASAAPELPSEEAGANALLYTMRCRDEDGFTLCDPMMAVAIQFTRFDCVPAPIARAEERARVTCAVAGRVRNVGGRPGSDHWAPLGLTRVDYWLPVDSLRWQADE